MNNVRRGRYELRRRRKGALERLLDVSEPDKRQQEEIETLQKRIG
ncbi:hypothetical protein LCGC14_0887280 [marine sediment metagenome]|uniref:Uncharacterized protein n=1 Tax=marine sediment metagenome TaxID=412755 RepID=A0A0F9PKZ1_9ZZZZ